MADRSVRPEPSERTTLVLPVAGLDCAECARHVEEALGRLPGVLEVEALPIARTVTVVLDPARTDRAAVERTLTAAGYPVDRGQVDEVERTWRRVVGLVVAAVLVVLAVVGMELSGLVERLNERVPWPVWLTGIVLGGLPIFRDVARATWQRRVTAHTLMTLGAVAAIVVGAWAAAAIVVLFMRLGAALETLTGGQARRALRELAALAPQRARVERDGSDVEVPVSSVLPGEVVVVRTGEAIPVDGTVVEGSALVDEAALTGEPFPRAVVAGETVYAASVVRSGYLRVRASAPAAESAFARIVRLVEGAEANRGRLQRVADRFSGWYLPVVVGVAALTAFLRRDPLAVAAVLVVACSCAFALATPIAMVATIGRAARRGVLVKGGAVIERLACVDVVLLDKTGTLTLGRPSVTDVVAFDDSVGEDDLLRYAASAERYAEHPLAEAIRLAARERGVALVAPESFVLEPGVGVTARVDGATIRVRAPSPAELAQAPLAGLEAQGKTIVVVERDGQRVGALAFADTLRPGVAEAVAELRRLGIRTIELLTGDQEKAAAALGQALGIGWRARLLPEDKLAVVRAYQAAGHVVAMVGDGINDAPALAQADVGIAMGRLGTALAAETADVVLLREDWSLVPETIVWSRRALRTAWVNLAGTGLYNLVGLALAGLGILPPTLAATAQVVPDVFILGNSARLGVERRRGGRR
ncbi:MAG: cation-translocating P-type ATPase [Thermomicrobium sp.]|nr:cation-translocating P-type ATPase [Thermomicrobium sp.]